MFFSDSELGLHHSLLKPNSLLVETGGTKKKDKERNKLEGETAKTVTGRVDRES